MTPAMAECTSFAPDAVPHNLGLFGQALGLGDPLAWFLAGSAAIGLVLVALEWTIGQRIELRSQVRAVTFLPVALGAAIATWTIVAATPRCPGDTVEAWMIPAAALTLALFVLGRFAVTRARRRRKPLAPPDVAARPA